MPGAVRTSSLSCGQTRPSRDPPRPQLSRKSPRACAPQPGRSHVCSFGRSPAMRCLLKLALALCLAVVAQVLVRPGGAGDEFAFTARVYVGTQFLGIPPESPEMVDAAKR